MKVLTGLSCLLTAVILSGCLGSGHSSTAPTLAFVYVVGQGDNAIRGFAQKTTGDLQASEELASAHPGADRHALQRRFEREVSVAQCQMRRRHQHQVSRSPHTK